jgi:hypothetical protein
MKKWGNMLQAGRSLVSFPIMSLDPSSRTLTLDSAQPLTQMSTRELPGGKGMLARKFNSLTAIYEPIV